MAVDVTASVLGSFRDVRSLTSSAGGVGFETFAGGFDLKRRRITNNEGGWQNQLDDHWVDHEDDSIGSVATAPTIVRPRALDPG